MPDTPPYAALAAGYDVVMEYVDYVAWAEHAHALIQRHHPETRSILELGCGTGTLAFELQELGPYRYHATDGSPEMVRVGEGKREIYGADVTFGVADFTDFEVEEPFDAVLLLYDGLNYLLDPADVRRLFECVHRALVPGGIFVFDQSTPANSENNEEYFEDAGEAEGFSYVRHSRYDRASRLHTTTFELKVEGETYHETHVQRAYEIPEIRLLLPETFALLGSYDGFTMKPATGKSERVHWVVRKGADGA